MAVTQGKTREDLRKAIGRNLGKMVTGTTSGSGSTTTAVDTTLFGGDDEYIGSYIRFTSGDNDGSVRRISDYTSSTGTMTFAAVGATVAGSTTYELWKDQFDPQVVDEFINQSIWEITGKYFDPEENVDLHTDRINARFEIPSEIAMIQDVYYRSKFTAKELLSCDSVFDETVDSDFTVSVDTEDYKKGSASNKFVIAAGASAGDIATDSITSVNLAKYDYIEFWIKSTVATSAGNLKILLDDSASCASPIETLNVPALTANTWKYCRVALSNPHTDTAIISVGLEYDSDLGACTVHLDDIKAVKNDTSTWTKLPRYQWRIDKEGEQGASTQDLVLTDGGRAEVGYSLIKLVGGDEPAELSADSDTTEVPERFIVAYATALSAQAGSLRPDADIDSMRNLAAFWFAKSEQAKNDLPFLTNVRLVR
tara:strand:- start:683 stop:1957 length:1275 start_codon:yes stop_codon:yes gene_type:complete